MAFSEFMVRHFGEKRRKLISLELPGLREINVASSGASFRKKICPSPSDVRDVRHISVPKLSEQVACSKIVQILIIGIM